MVKKYWQQTIDGGEVLIGSNGKVYKTAMYRFEFTSAEYNLGCGTLRQLRSLSEAIRQMKELLKTSKDIQGLGKLARIRIYNNDTNTLLKEYTRVASIKL